MIRNARLMLKKMALGLLFISFTMIGMKRASAPTEQSLLTLLPVEILNRIAWYLDFCETDEEFVERVRAQKEVSDEHIRLLDKHRPSVPVQNASLDSLGSSALTIDDEEGESLSLRSKSRNKLIATYSIDQSKIIFFEKEDDGLGIPAWLAIVDIKTNTLVKNQFAECAAYQRHLHYSSNTIHNIALSHNMVLIAELHKIFYCERTYSRDSLAVRGVVAPNNSTSFIVAADGGTESYKISFNKQGTKVITMSKRDNAEHTLFFLVPEAEHNLRSTKKLHTYFTCKAVCKPIHKEAL